MLRTVFDGILWVPPNRALARWCLLNLSHHCTLLFSGIMLVHSMFIVPLALPLEYNRDHSRFPCPFASAETFLLCGPQGLLSFQGRLQRQVPRVLITVQIRLATLYLDAISCEITSSAFDQGSNRAQA